MFTNYQNPTYTLYTILKKIKVNSTLIGIDKTIQLHPNYPSLLSIIDTLNDYNVENAAYKITEPEKLTSLPVPFISFLNSDGGNFVVVTDISNKAVTYSINDKEFSTSLEKFIKEWNQTVLLVEATKNSSETNYFINSKTEVWQKIKIPALIFLGTILVLISAFWQQLYSLHFSIAFYPFAFFSLAGVFVTTLLLWFEVDKANPALQKICTGAKKVNCSAILNSNQSKLLGLISWSEIGFFYFTFSYLTLVLEGCNSLFFLNFLSLIALPYTIFSLLYQWRIVKQWCILCLWVQVILVCQFLTTIIFNPHWFYDISTNLLSIKNWANVLNPSLIISFITPLLWYFIKPLLVNKQKNKRNIQELNRIKYNTNVFYGLLNKQKMISNRNSNLGIIIGNENAKNTIIKVCNPYCGPCAKAHPRLESLLHQIPNLKIQIIFAAPSSIKDNPNNPISHLMAIASKNDPVLTKKALDDWYLAPKKYYPSFADKYRMDAELELQKEKIVAMHEWCLETNITYTPTIFFNGYQLPEAYNIEDLRHFMEENNV